MKKLYMLLVLIGLLSVLIACRDDNGDDDVLPSPVITEIAGIQKEFIQGDDVPDFTTYVTIVDDIDGVVTVTTDMIDLSRVNMNVIGTFRVTYSYTNSVGQTTEYDIVIRIIEPLDLFGNCDPNFPAGQINFDLGGIDVRFGTWMRNFLDPFWFTAKPSELNDMKRTCFTRAETEHDATIKWYTYANALNHYNEIIQQYLTGSFQADWFNINSHYLGILAEAGAIRPITEYMDHLPDFYFDINKQFGTWKGEVYGVWNERINVNMGIYVNLDLIEEYSQTNPAELWEDGEWNWSALMNIASSIKENAPSNIEIFGINSYNLGSYLIGANGGKVIDPDTDMFALEDPRVYNALEFAQELNERGYVFYGDDDTATRVRFTSGEMVFYFGADWISGDPQLLKPGAAVQFPLGMVPFPVGPDIVDFEAEYRLPITVGNLWVLRGDATDAEAEQYVQFFSNMFPWGDDEVQDLRYTDTMRDHMDDRTSLRAYVSGSRMGYFEKSFVYQVVWGTEVTDGVGNLFGMIINNPGESVTAAIAANLPALQAKVDQMTGREDD
ncbi:MAG: extracellular solute-binding protein [Acholeplasmataceae bacterium]|nr:MAG: extracellular solute-binding protein [Acholeplasmataceae bacterium]